MLNRFGFNPWLRNFFNVMFFKRHMCCIMSKWYDTTHLDSLCTGCLTWIRAKLELTWKNICKYYLHIFFHVSNTNHPWHSLKKRYLHILKVFSYLENFDYIPSPFYHSTSFIVYKSIPKSPISLDLGIWIFILGILTGKCYPGNISTACIVEHPAGF